MQTKGILTKEQFCLLLLLLLLLLTFIPVPFINTMFLLPKNLKKYK